MSGQLASLIEKILAKKKINQTVLGGEMRPQKTQSQLSKIAHSSDWEDHYQFILQLLEIAKKLGIDPAQDLKDDATEKEGVDHVIRHAAMVTNTQQKKAVQNKKADIGAISPRKSASHSRR